MSIPEVVPPGDASPLIEDCNDGLTEGSTYLFDLMHFPYPLAPLTMSVFTTAWSDGATRGFHDLGISMRRWRVIGRNHYRFDWQEMDGVTDDESARRTGEAIEATMRREMGQLLERWNVDHLPAVQASLDRLEALTGRVPTAGDVPGLLDEVLAAFADLWRIHFIIVIPMSTAMQVFDDFHVDVFGGGEEDGHPLLAGQITGSVRATFGLSDLAARARELGLAQTILEHGEKEALEALATTAAGRAFLDDLDAYLVEYGLRQDLFDLATPTWREQPAFAMTNVRNYLRTGLDARSHHAEIQARASEAVDQARARLASYPQPVREQFEVMLAMAQAGSFLQEEHNFYIDQVGLARLRLFFIAIGQRLVGVGSIDAPEDVFFLSLDEVRSAIEAPDLLQETMTTQRRELDVAQSFTPPPFLGAPPAGPPSTATPGERSMVRFFGAAAPESDDPDRVVGNLGARGTATGIARVVRTLDEARALQPGEILVTVTTMPPWSPLFAIAAGMVTETGGPLSHCAIVAREYGIPVVVVAPNASRRIVTGQRIRIDGSTGVVELDA